jgi:hypothetical protein
MTPAGQSVKAPTNADRLREIEKLLARTASNGSDEGRRIYLAYLLAGRGDVSANPGVRESVAELRKRFR